MANTNITIERETMNDWQLVTVRVGDDVPGTACVKLTLYYTGREDEWRYIVYASCVNNLDDGSYNAFTGQGNHETAHAAAITAIQETVTKLFSSDTRGYRDYELAGWAMQASYLTSEVNRRF